MVSAKKTGIFHVARRNRRKTDWQDRLFYAINAVVLGILAISILYPLYFVVIASVSDSNAVLNGEVVFWPVGFTLEGYALLLNETRIWRGYLNTIVYTVLGTLFNLFLTIPAGWALSRKDLPFRKILMAFFTVVMFFGGGLIPYYILVSNLGLVDSPLILIIGGGINIWNLFVCKSYYQSNIPSEVIEAAEVDGSGEFRTFFSVVLPLSKPLVSVMALFYAVGHWNNYFDAMIFISNDLYTPLQLVLKDILIGLEAMTESGQGESIAEQIELANQIKYASIIVSSLPVIIVFPFIQKYFEKGFLVGTFK